jgi:hypothetical protein
MSPPGQPVRLLVERDAARREILLPVPRRHVPLWWALPAQLAAGFLCFLFAMLMGLLKPDNRTAQLGCITFWGLAMGHLATPLLYVFVSLDDMGRAVLGAVLMVGAIPAATGYLFCSIFPERVQAGRKWILVGAVVITTMLAEWLRALPFAVLSILDGPAGVRYLVRFEKLLALADRWPKPVLKTQLVIMFIGAIAVLLRNYRLLPNPDHCRRIRWVIFGNILGLTPELLLYLGVAARYFTGYGVRMDAPWFTTLEQIAVIWLGVVCPIVLGYAVLSQRVLGIRFCVRRSIQYLLARHVLQAAIFLPVAWIAARILWNPRVTVRELLFGNYYYFVAVVAGALVLFYRRSLLLALDHRFFREAYNQERILRGLVEEIKELDSISRISRLVSEKVQMALHPQRVLLFYRRERHSDFTLGHSSENSDAELRVTADCPILRSLEQTPVPRDFPFSADSAEEAYFARLGVRLMTPITGSEHRLVGILMLGEKLSEEPYTPSDRDLLQAIAAQIGIVYENVTLRETARREMQIKRHVLAHLEGADINILKECPKCGRCYDRSEVECATDGTELLLTLPVERTIDGVYRLEQRIGAGGMGAIYRATDLRLQRLVAVKVMIGGLFGNETALRRFEREARAAARLSHPNIVSIFDFGVIGGDGAYLVMELVDGFTLRSELRELGTLTSAKAAIRFEHMLEGLTAAHAAGVVHRDLKPENLIVARLTGGGELLKILDFGLAKVYIGDSSETRTLTAAGVVVGTMGYMSPEQLMGEDVDARTDTFSVGVMAVEAITGRRPFEGSSYPELLRATLHGDYHLPGATQEILRLDAVIGKCLEHRRDARPTPAQIKPELIEAMRACPPFVLAPAGMGGMPTVQITAP